MSWMSTGISKAGSPSMDSHLANETPEWRAAYQSALRELDAEFRAALAVPTNRAPRVTLTKFLQVGPLVFFEKPQPNTP